MKKIILLIAILLLALCAGAENLDPVSLYPEYTGEPLENSAAIIDEIMAANNVRANIEKFGALRQDIYIPSGEGVAPYRADVAFVQDGLDIIQIIEDPEIRIYAVNGVAYMIENGAIFTMPVENLPANIPALDDFVFVYDETEVVLGAREWEGGNVYLARADDTWLEYFLDESMFICAIKTYTGEENPEFTGYITVTGVETPEIPSFIIREANK